jgi:hypothetical protein
VAAFATKLPRYGKQAVPLGIPTEHSVESLMGEMLPQ